jgi:hypothetical protein
MISGGLLWVFVAMVVFAILQAIGTLFMPGGRSGDPISRIEALEAVAG